MMFQKIKPHLIPVLLLLLMTIAVYGQRNPNLHNMAESLT